MSWLAFLRQLRDYLDLARDAQAAVERRDGSTDVVCISAWIEAAAIDVDQMIAAVEADLRGLVEKADA